MANRIMRTIRLRTVLTSVAAAVMLVVTLAGCSSNNDALAQQYKDGSGKNYVAGDGTITEIKPQNRAAPVAFAGKLEDGKPTTSAMYAGKVLVLNFWYAGCAPCRAEAPALEKTYTKFAGQGVEFLGVNVRDQADTARAFARTYGVTYPSVLDASDGAMQLAFSGIVAPNAVPTTLVVDKDGRVAARILGQLPDASVLSALISTVQTEQGP
ncbi:TlpA family protein disulfide reductase [Leifsonia shinshuensis]|uniref:TlpA family protein disulfide reductase n=1 Tax=Leifsonia shinshuensis TaxID=150026 RepID=UPI0027E2D6D5|nr:TlpA disulfide reductase family protein [Leifsonia shinshuensis]